MLFATVHRTRTGSGPRHGSAVTGSRPWGARFGRGRPTAVLVAAMLLCTEGLASARGPIAPVRAPLSIRAAPEASQGATAVLGLDGSDAAVADALTVALRKAFAARGLSSREELTLAEVRLMMGCNDDSPKCLTQAGESMGVERVIHGELRSAGADYRLELHVVSVVEGIEEAQTSHPLQKAQLAPDRIEQTADEIVNGLFPRETDPVEPDVITEPVPTSDGPPPRVEPKSEYEWGSYTPRPAWKWAGFGIGIGLLVAGGAAAIGTGVVIESGSLREELIDAARASTQDVVVGPNGEETLNTNNDVPLGSRDLCVTARQSPINQPDRVTNRSVTLVCNRADTYELVNAIGFGVAAAGALTTIVFTTLLFVHRKDPGARARLRERDLRLSAGRLHGGFALGGSFRF